MDRNHSPPATHWTGLAEIFFLADLGSFFFFPLRHPAFFRPSPLPSSLSSIILQPQILCDFPPHLHTSSRIQLAGGSALPFFSSHRRQLILSCPTRPAPLARVLSVPERPRRRILPATVQGICLSSRPAPARSCDLREEHHPRPSIPGLIKMSYGGGYGGGRGGGHSNGGHDKYGSGGGGGRNDYGGGYGYVESFPLPLRAQSIPSSILFPQPGRHVASSQSERGAPSFFLALRSPFHFPPP